jgi:hypothetical protein
MPDYEFECTNGQCGHTFHKLYTWRVADGINVLDDPDMQDCEKCGSHADQLFSLCKMKPDRFWAGFYDDRLDKYWTSESRFNKHLKENELEFIGDRTDRESLTKIASNANKEKDVKHERAVEKAIVDTLAWQDEWGDFGTVKQRNKKARERARLESECPADVFEDPAFK